MPDPTLELPVTTPTLPSVAGYRVESLCGSGGMARVYKAQEDGLERPVAIKVLSTYGREADALRERFEREARLVATLQHPAIISIFRITRTRDGELCIVMPWLNGTLADRSLPMPEAEVRSLLSTLLDALEHAHNAQIVHRDLKPENVLFDAAGRPLLADFGVALRVGGDARITAPGLTVGSARYMSPEQALGREVDARSDLYSLGIMAYELLTGAAPFQAGDAIAAALAHVEAPVPRLPRGLIHWQDWIDRALAKAPESRFSNAATMRDCLPAPAPVLPGPVSQRHARAGLKRATWVALSLLAVAALVLGLWPRSKPPVELVNTPPAPAASGTQAPPPVLPEVLPDPIAADPASALIADPPPVVTAPSEILPGPGAAYDRFRDEPGPWVVAVPATLGTSKLGRNFASSQSEVTLAEYRQFVEATQRRDSACAGGRSWRDPGFSQADDHPVVCVSHADARAYAEWLSGRTGKRYRLPTVAEFKHLSAPINGASPACEEAQLSTVNCPRQATTSVETFVASTPGLFGLVGNVREWSGDCQWQVKKRNVVARSVTGIGRWIQRKPQLPKEERICIGRLAVGSSFADGTAWPAPQTLGEQQARPDLGFRLVRED